MFRQSLLKRRAAVPTAGFYEWTPVPGRKKKDRYLFTLSEEKILYLAGFWSVFYDSSSGEPKEHFTILTTEANESMEQFHNRMPVILTEAEAESWLSEDAFQKYLDRAQPTLKAEKN